MVFDLRCGSQIAGPPKRLGPPPGGSTCADPPPERTLVSAFDPMIAIDLTRAASSGSREFAFFSNTELCSATLCAVAAPLKGSTTRPSGGSSTTPATKAVRRMRWTISSTRLIGTSPASTAFLRASPKCARSAGPPGCSASNPARAALAVLCVAFQSEITAPLKPQVYFRS